MNKIAIAKTVSRLAMGSGAGLCIRTIIQSHVQPANLIQSIQITAGSIALGGIAAREAGKYSDELIDSAVDAFNSFKNKTN